MIQDLDEVLEKVLTWTLVFWLLPYIVWYFFRLLIETTWKWVTEPEQPRQ